MSARSPRFASCCGAQPWLRRGQGLHSCAQPLQTVQRGGSNVYFPVVSSSIFVPPGPHSGKRDDHTACSIRPAVWTALTSSLIDGQVSNWSANLAGVYNVDRRALVQRGRASPCGMRRRVVATTEEEFRRQEYDVLCQRGGVAY